MQHSYIIVHIEKFTKALVHFRNVDVKLTGQCANIVGRERAELEANTALIALLRDLTC